jgi:hypothetical protein
MIVAIERTKFTYLYKYNQIRVDINQLIDKSTNELKDMLNNDLNNLIQLFNKALPLFEQDHEIILLEVDKSKINLQDGILISFDSIHCIYPLTKTGLQLLYGKINDDFILEPPVFENAIEALRINRSMAYRRATSIKLLIHYNMDALLQKSMLSLIESAVEKNLLDKSKPQVFNTFLDHLIAYNKTPSYIPDGNIEHICKIGAITIKYLGKAEEVFINGPFYKSSIKYISQINSPSYLSSYLAFNSIEDSELKSSIEKMVEIISKDYNGIDIFKVSFFFLAFKSFLNKHDNNIELLNNDIEVLIENDNQSASFVLVLLGYTFSIESIYEGLHKISNAPLLKSTQSKVLAGIEKRERMDEEIEKQNVIEKVAEEQENIRLSELMHKEDTKSEAVFNVAENANVEVLELVQVVEEVSNKPEIAADERENVILNELLPKEKTKSEAVFNVTENNNVEVEELAQVVEEVSHKPEIAADEQENIIFNELLPKEKTKSEVVFNVTEHANNGVEEVLEVVEKVIHNPIETNSVPFGINENSEKAAELESDEATQQILNEIKSSTGAINANSTETLKDKLTVQSFKVFISKNYTITKQKQWFYVIEISFPSKHDELSLEILSEKLDTFPELKDRLFKSNKDEKLIKSFFDI